VEETPAQPAHSLNIKGLDGSRFQIQVDLGGFVHMCHEMVLVISCNAYKVYVYSIKKGNKKRQFENPYHSDDGMTISHIPYFDNGTYVFSFSSRFNTKMGLLLSQLVFSFFLRLVELRLMMVQPWKMHTDTSQRRWV